MFKETLRGAAVAAAMASMIGAGIATVAHAADAPKTVKCKGANECKGKGGCKSAENACKGKNSCKGHVFEAKDEKECKDMGGTVTK